MYQLLRKILICCLPAAIILTKLQSQPLLANIEERNFRSLNGSWQVIVDPFDAGKGSWKPIWKDQQPAGKNDFFEYQFNPALTLNVPGDWNSQRPDLLYYEGTLWYKKEFNYQRRTGKRVFLYFAAVNYFCEVYLNGEKLGWHEGGFTPFQFEVTDQVKQGNNRIILRVNNQRKDDQIPALNFDWWNYGGITRDVYLAETGSEYIADYFVQLRKGSSSDIAGSVQLEGTSGTRKVRIRIPELKIDYNCSTDARGRAEIEIRANPALWSPSNPKCYDLFILSDQDSIHESIGFRTIEVKGTEILLNGQPIFLRGINIHEEIPMRAGRAYSWSDAALLLGWAKELGCNFVRLTHYPHSEHMVRMADQLGILLWEEIPLWQGIQFSNPAILTKAGNLLEEMIGRDKNRCSIIVWSLSNETTPSASRNETLKTLAFRARILDPTRLITSAFNHIRYEKNRVTIDDSLSEYLDVIGVNEYIGWYTPWPARPEEMEWRTLFNKPLIMSEFGAESLYGNHGSADTASLWNEEYQDQVYQDQLKMFKGISFLRGITPWVMADFRSPGRLHSVYQQGWNRKGLLSDRGFKKKAWYRLHDYYTELKKQENPSIGK
jgi:beta-glucuronidase